MRKYIIGFIAVISCLFIGMYIASVITVPEPEIIEVNDVIEDSLDIDTFTLDFNPIKGEPQ